MRIQGICLIIITAVIETITDNILSPLFPKDASKWIVMVIINLVWIGIVYFICTMLQKNQTQKDSEIIKEYREFLKECEVNTKEELEKFEELNKNLDLIGIDSCTSKLQDTQLSPEQCLKKVNKTLYFMGVAGSKWVKEPPVYAEFEKMLMRVSRKGDVRFLLLNPLGEGWNELKQLRRDNLSDESYKKFRDLCKEFPQLKVRLYDSMPSFRLQFVDDSFVAVSRYKFEFTEYQKTHYGWDAPHLIVENEVYKLNQEGVGHFWSLYLAFQYLYNYIWDHSIDLDILWEEEGDDTSE